MSIRQAAVEAARERLRPILMTSFAFILGVLPLMLASGAGAGAAIRSAPACSPECCSRRPSAFSSFRSSSASYVVWPRGEVPPWPPNPKQLSRRRRSTHDAAPHVCSLGGCRPRLGVSRRPALRARDRGQLAGADGRSSHERLVARVLRFARRGAPDRHGAHRGGAHGSATGGGRFAHVARLAGPAARHDARPSGECRARSESRSPRRRSADPRVPCSARCVESAARSVAGAQRFRELEPGRHRLVPAHCISRGAFHRGSNLGARLLGPASPRRSGRLRRPRRAGSHRASRGAFAGE